MATSGTLSPSGGYQGRKLSFSWSLARQSIEGNYSVISWSLSAVGGSSSYYYHHKEQLWVAGAWRYNNTNNTKRYKGTITSGSVTIYHNDDGKGSFSAELYAAIYTAAQNQSGSASWSLPDIPRVSDISVNKSSVPADGSTTITATATKKSSSFTDTIVVELGDYSKTVTSGTAFTIPKTWINAIDGTAATATVTVTTKSGSTTIGSKSVNFTVTVPSTVVPSISSVAVSEAVTAVQTAFGSGVYVSSLSKLNVDITAAGIYGSTIESIKTTFDGITYTGASFQTAALSKAGTLPMVVTVTDSRGRTKTTTKDITVYGYSAPIITSVSCVSSGTSTVVTVSGVVAPVAVSGSNKNTKTLKIKYKASTATTYGGETTVTIPAADWTFSVSKTFTLDSRNTTYDFEAKLSDKISTATEYGSTGKPVISFKAQAKGVTVGAEATEDGFVVANGWDAKFTGNVYIELDADTAALWDEVFGSGGGVIKLIDLIYPIGKVESTTNAKWNPNTLFPWQTWERYAKGRTLVGVDESDSSFNTVGKTGGNKTHHHNLSSDGWADTVIDGNYTYGSYISVENNMMMLRIRGASGQENASSVSKPYATPLGGKTNAANGLQPYVTVYYWRRTA